MIPAIIMITYSYMLSAIPNTFGNSLNISSVFLWNLLSADAAPNGSHLYLYLPNWHVDMVNYDDYSFHLRLWYLELSPIRDKYLTLVSFGNISLKVGPMDWSDECLVKPCWI